MFVHCALTLIIYYTIGTFFYALKSHAGDDLRCEWPNHLARAMESAQCKKLPQSYNIVYRWCVYTRYITPWPELTLMIILIQRRLVETGLRMLNNKPEMTSHACTMVVVLIWSVSGTVFMCVASCRLTINSWLSDTSLTVIVRLGATCPQ